MLSFLLGFVTSSFFLWLGRRAYVRRRLARPMCRGIYLPRPTDPRWEKEYSYWYELGKFAVDCHDGQVKFEGKHIGYWKVYAKAVKKACEQRYLKDAAERSLQAIEDGK